MYLFLSLAVSVGGMDGGIGSWFLFLGVVRLVDSEAKFRGGVTGALDPVPMVLWTRHPIHRAAERTCGTAGTYWRQRPTNATHVYRPTHVYPPTMTRPTMREVHETRVREPRLSPYIYNI